MIKLFVHFFHLYTDSIYKGKGMFQLRDVRFVKFIERNYYKVVYPSQELFDLVDNDFKTIEQIQFEKELMQANEHHRQAMESAKTQICYSRWAFIVALVTLLITLVFSIYESVRVNSNTIEKQQSPIIIQQKLDDDIKNKMTNDTLKVNEIKSQKKKTK